MERMHLEKFRLDQIQNDRLSVIIYFYMPNIWQTVPIFGKPCINDVMKGYTDVFDEDLFNLGHCNLITHTIKLIGCWPIKLRAYFTPL